MTRQELGNQRYDELQRQGHRDIDWSFSLAVADVALCVVALGLGFWGFLTLTGGI